jgi:hypothetical protein
VYSTISTVAPWDISHVGLSILATLLSLWSQIKRRLDAGLNPACSGLTLQLMTDIQKLFGCMSQDPECSAPPLDLQWAQKAAPCSTYSDRVNLTVGSSQELRFAGVRSGGAARLLRESVLSLSNGSLGLWGPGMLHVEAPVRGLTAPLLTGLCGASFYRPQGERVCQMLRHSRQRYSSV